MALRKLPKEMSYAAIRHKHPPTPNHASGPAQPADTKAQKAVEPSGPPREDRVTVAAGEGAAGIEAPAEARREAPPTHGPDPAQGRAPESAPARKPASGKGVRVRGYVHIPAIGDHRDFDELREIYGEKEALALALSHGITSYEAALREASPLKPPSRPDRRSNRVEASRTMAHDLYLKAVEHLDPKGMLGRSQIGSRILDTALEHYFGER